MRRVEQNEGSVEEVLTPVVEIKRFLEEPKVAYKANVWEWWFARKEKYPSLYKIAMQHLIVPATSAESERIFSLAGNLVTVKRSRLTGEHLNMLIFLNKNLY